MNQRQAPAILTPALAVVVLVAFALSGLMTGVLARGFVGSLSSSAARTTTPTATPIPTTHATASPTPLPAVTPNAAFVLAISAAPRPVSPGATITITVAATVKATGAPLPGLLCTLGPSQRDGSPLLSAWPAAKTTDAQGIATWQVTAPAQPGQYTVEVSATGSHKYSWFTDAIVNVGD